MKTAPPMSAPCFLHGYWAEARGRRYTEMAPPAVNMFLTSSGSAYTRPGFEDTGWDLNNASHAHVALWVSEYNVTFFASDNKVVYVDHEKANAVYDTGLSLSAETHLSYYNGAVYATNPTDGVYRIGLSRVEGAHLAAATSLSIEDGTTFRFESANPSTARIKGANETYTSRDDTDWQFDGTNLTQAYANGDLVIQTKALSSIPKFKKAVFWEEAMHGFGPQTVTSNQTAKRTLFYGQFAAAGTWTQHESFSGGLSGSQVVGKKGVLENGLEIEDYLYLFTSDESYTIPVSELNRSTGARIPHIFSRKYSAQNIRAADEMDGKIVFADLKKKRIIRSKVEATAAGARLVPDELFDAPVRNLLKNMDATQSFPIVFYWEEQNYLLVQLTIGGQITTLVYDNNPIQTIHGNSEGRWLPPVTNWQVKCYFTKAGRLHGTDLMDDTVYEFAVGESDDGADIESVWAGGVLEVNDGRTMTEWGDLEVSGGLTRGTEIAFQPYLGGVEGAEKPFGATGLNFGNSSCVSQVRVGSAFTPGAGVGASFADFDKSWRVSPAQGRSFQAVIRCEGEGQAMRIDSWKLPKVKFQKSSNLSTT